MTKDGKEQSEYVKAIDDLRREIRAEMRGLKESVKYSSDIYDEVKAITAELKGLRKEVKQLTESNRNLQVENKALTLKVDELEQYQRANNLEVKGVPLEGDPSEIVKKLCEVLGEPVLDSDIDICHRVPTAKDTEKNIIVRFTRRTTRNAVLAKAKKKRTDTSALGFTNVRRPVYVNEHLTRQKKQLLGAAVARKRVTGWKYVWTSGGKVYARRNEGTNPIKIDCQEDVEKMTA